MVNDHRPGEGGEAIGGPNGCPGRLGLACHGHWLMCADHLLHPGGAGVHAGLSRVGLGGAGPLVGVLVHDLYRQVLAVAAKAQHRRHGKPNLFEGLHQTPGQVVLLLAGLLVLPGLFPQHVADAVHYGARARGMALFCALQLLVIAGILQGFYFIGGPIAAAIEREMVPSEQMGRWIGITRFFKMLTSAALALFAGIIWDKIGPQYIFIFFVGIDMLIRLPLLISIPETLHVRFKSKADG